MTATFPLRGAHTQAPHTVLVHDTDVLRVLPFRRRDVLVARLRAGALDRQLAAGVAPESSYALAVRTAVLTSRRQRARLAECWAHASERAQRPVRPGDPYPLVDPSALNRAREEITALINALQAPRPVAVEGVAIAWGLLRAATSPVYAVRRNSSDALASALDRALTAL